MPDSPKISPYELINAVDNKYAAEAPTVPWWSWEPETLTHQITKDFGELTESHWSVLKAAAVIKANPAAFTTNMLTFAFCIKGLNGCSPYFSHFPVCTPEELLFGVSLATRLAPKSIDGYASEVSSYIAACFTEAGVYAYPSILKRFQPNTDAETKEAIRNLVENPDSSTKEGLREPMQKNASAAMMVKIQVSKLHNMYAYCAAKLSNK